MTYEEFLRLTKENLKRFFSGLFSGEKSGNQGGVKE